MPVTNNFKKDKDKEIETMMGLLREVYDFIEMDHLRDSKMIPIYSNGFKKSLGERIFGYLKSKDQTFRDKVIKRQNRWMKYVQPKLDKISQLKFMGKELPDDLKKYEFAYFVNKN